ncbi:hypothetical protein HSBAA_15130 [Vreelandella sulfidaeris]|uniref:Uncharacterized protein n=1 Tax=Vreelandella sulfidaeris TaxID=115553 RepID=A0A455U3M8_9GAMM|nr:hypothetical protein HSBAA_15130 [Halomonas sulfidaeris]
MAIGARLARLGAAKAASLYACLGGGHVRFEILIIATLFVRFLDDPEWSIWRTNWFVNKVFVLTCFVLVLASTVPIQKSEGATAMKHHVKHRIKHRITRRQSLTLIGATLAAMALPTASLLPTPTGFA